MPSLTQRALALSALVVLCGCGGGTAPTAPTASPAPSPPPSPATRLEVHGSEGVLLPGESEQYTATVPSRGDVTRDVTWESLTPGVLTVTAGLVHAVAPGIGQMRASYQGLSFTDRILVAMVTPAPVGGASRGGSDVVIAEFRTSGDGGSRDEFVELLNASSGVVDISGWSVAWADAEDRAGTLGNFFPGATLAPGQRFLLINVMCPQCFNGPAAAFEVQDYRFRGNLPERGGLALVGADGRIADQVAFGAHARYGEGTPLPGPLGGDASYSRTADTDDNASDFTAGPATPEGSACRTNARCP